MIPKLVSLGGMLDAVGRAAVPAPAQVPRSAPQTSLTTFDDLTAVLGRSRTVDEARVDHTAAVGWQERAPTFGRAIGVGVGIGLGVFAVRALRSAFGSSKPLAPPPQYDAPSK